MLATSSPQSTTTIDSHMYRNFLVAMDDSSYAKQGMSMAVQLARLTTGSKITGIHVNPSSLFESRLSRLEEGLPS